MDSITRNPPKSPPFAWGLVWLSQFLIIGCLYSIPTIAIHRVMRPGLPPRAPDWHLPLLLSAVYASVMTWQGWYTRHGDRGRYRPKPRTYPAARKKRRLVLSLALGVPFLLLECLWVFGLGQGRANWPLLLALNAGMAAGVGLLAWASRLMPDAPGPDTDPLAPDAVPSLKQTPLPEPVREVAYAGRADMVLPEALLFCITLVCVSAIVVLSFASSCLNLGLGRNGYSPWSLFSP